MNTPTLTAEEREALDDVRYGYGDVPSVTRRISETNDEPPKEPASEAA